MRYKLYACVVKCYGSVCIMLFKVNRRSFVKTGFWGLGSLAFDWSQLIANQQGDGWLRGFVFSDAHIGWRGADQPTLQEQSAAIKTIKRRFPNLDVVFDSGDVHHGYLNEEERNGARDFWLSSMANQFPDSLFHYVPGNHELGRGPRDTELTAAKLGSINFRPYYSFDHKGIHFISLPELLDTILINKESLQWLAHDLSENKNKTTLIFSHNSIKGTTFDNGETAYRRIINSDELIKVINAHPNVQAWFHGHNHHYEVVKKAGRVYISNGRIGGFNPPKSWGAFGQGHLGGVYFEVGKAGMLVRCFSATKNKFLDELGFPNLSIFSKKQTSFNHSSNTNYFFGSGQTSDNVTYQVRNHFLSEQAIEVKHKLNKNGVVNDNTELSFPTKLFFAGKQRNRLVGYQILPKDVRFSSEGDGLKISKKGYDGDVVLIIPKKKLSKNNFMTRGSYFRCEDGDRFKVKLSMPQQTKDAEVLVKFFVYNEQQEILHESDCQPAKATNGFSYTHLFDIPKLKPNGVFNKYLKVSITIKNTANNFVINQAVLEKIARHKESRLQVNGNDMPCNKRVLLDSPLKAINQIRYRGQSSSLLFKVSDVKWQIRNAVAEYEANKIKIIDYVHLFQKNREIVITPTNKPAHYVSMTSHLAPYTITIEPRKLSIQMDSYQAQSRILVKHKFKPKQIHGAEVQSTDVHQTLLKPNSKHVFVTF